MIARRFGIFLAAVILTANASAAPKRRPVPENTGLVDIPVQRYRAGVALGLGIPTTDGYGSARALFGADFYVIHDDDYDYGISYLTGGKRLPTGRRWRANFIGAELNYKLARVSPGFYVGAAAGAVSFDGGDAFLPGLSDVYAGPKAGIERMITRSFSLGLEGKLLLVTSSPLIVWIDLLGSVRYHF